MLHPETNASKIESLEDLHKEYVAYLRICANQMLSERRYHLERTEKQAFFLPASALTSQIEKNARQHAITIVSSWFLGRYAMKMKNCITKLFKDGKISEEQRIALYTIGKYAVCKPGGYITQTDIDLYNELLDGSGGNKPEIQDDLPMLLSEATSRLEDPDEAIIADHWLRVSTLESRKSLWLPLVGNPYVASSEDVSKGIQARKTKRGIGVLKLQNSKTVSSQSYQRMPPNLEWT